MKLKSHRKGPGVGLFLVFIGIFILLHRMGIASFSWFSSLSHWWPLLLVAMGINMILPKKWLLRTGVWIVFFGIIIATGIIGVGTNDKNETVFSLNVDSNITSAERIHRRNTFDTLKENITSLAISLDLGPGNLAVRSGKEGEVSSWSPEHLGDMTVNVLERAGRKEFHYKQKKKWVFGWNEEGKHQHDFAFPENLPLNLSIDMPVIGGKINLENTKTARLKMDYSFGDVSIYYGNKEPLVYTEIDAGVSEINLYIPKDAGLEMKVDSWIKEVSISGVKMEKVVDGVYRTVDFETAPVKFFTMIDLGAGGVNVSATEKEE